MPSAKLAAAAVLAALSLSACGVAAKPQAGTLKAIEISKKGVDNPRTKHIVCLRQKHIPVHAEQVTVGGQALPAFQVGSPPAGPTVAFEPTPGAAQFAQIDNVAPGAEVIGSALLFTNQASDRLLTKVENCVALGVTG
jgi:hypothetical protein